MLRWDGGPSVTYQEHVVFVVDRRRLVVGHDGGASLHGPRSYGMISRVRRGCLLSVVVGLRFVELVIRVSWGLADEACVVGSNVGNCPTGVSAPP